MSTAVSFQKVDIIFGKRAGEGLSLLDKGATANVSDTFYKAPMLAFVLHRKHWDVAKLLIAKSTDADETLGTVAGTGRAELVEAVLAARQRAHSYSDKSATSRAASGATKIPIR